jgi:hypothetical protein
MTNEIILSRIYDYCKKVSLPVRKSGNVVMLKCPFCEGDELTANVIPNTTIINCLKCHRRYTLFEIAAAVLSRQDGATPSREEVSEYLARILRPDSQEQKDDGYIEKLLDRYEAEGFCLVPCAKKDKNPIQKGWTEKENRNKHEWIGWIANGLNVGVRTGQVSNITVVDIDILTKQEKAELVRAGVSQERIREISQRKKIPDEIREIMGDPWIQETLGGYHLFYKYTNLPKTRIKRDGYYIDLENDGGLIVVAPAPQTAVYEENCEDSTGKKQVAGYAARNFINDNAIPLLPDRLKELLLEGAPVPSQSGGTDKPDDAHRISEVKLNILDDGDGRNVFFTSYGGYLRKQLNLPQIEYALHGLNKMLCKTELGSTEIQTIARSLDKYSSFDRNQLEYEILNYLSIVEGLVYKPDIEIAVLGKRAVGEDKKRIDATLVGLVKQEKIVHQGRRYKIIPRMNWSGNILQIGTPVNFNVPYLHDFAYFNWGDMILIGAQTKIGKTTLAMNIVKRLVEQGVRPYYIYSESGGRWAEAAWSLGLKDDDIWVPETITEHIDEVKFEKNSVTVWDWIDPPDFAKINHYFTEILKKVEKTKSFLIGFVQLKDDKDASWFAPNMIRQRPALAVKYLYDNQGDGTHTRFLITEVRAPKTKGKQFTIPCKYDFQTKEVFRIDETGEAETQEVEEWQ